MNTKKILHRIVAAFLAVVLTMSLLPNEYMQKIGISSAVYAYDTNNILSISNSSATLQNGNIYKVTGNVSISRADGSAQAGLTVADGATVVLYIEEGCTLTVKGSAANGTIQGYPGIYIPVGSTLVVTGGGTLKATGGSAGNGTKGNNNQKTAIVKDASWDYINSGAGGNGGAGGAGAGAGIGGYGGNGGAGGAGAGYVTTGAYGGSDANCTGNPGGAGYQGGNGSSMGNLILLGNVTVNAVGGLASTTQGGVGTRYTDGPSGEGNTNYCANDSGSGWDTSYGSGCGGPGGGGGSGYGATGIGGGAAGAGGGGGGASGGNVGRGNKDNFGWSELGHAGQGGGGIGNVNGGGILNEGRINNGGYSGAGGAAGYAGGNGFFYKASTVTCSARNSDAGDSDSRVVNAKKLITNILTYSNETWAEGENANDVKEDVTFGYKIKSAEVPDIAKEKRGYTLRGYYTQPQGKGTKVINADGKTYVNKSNKPLSDYLNKNGYWLGVYNTTLSVYPRFSLAISGTSADLIL